MTEPATQGLDLAGTLTLGARETGGPARDEHALRARVRELVRAGKLPNRRPERTWGGRGEESRCPICALAVRRNEVEFEVEFRSLDPTGGTDTYHVHAACYWAWTLECQGLSEPAGAAAEA